MKYMLMFYLNQAEFDSRTNRVRNHKICSNSPYSFSESAIKIKFAGDNRSLSPCVNQLLQTMVPQPHVRGSKQRYHYPCCAAPPPSP